MSKFVEKDFVPLFHSYMKIVKNEDLGDISPLLENEEKVTDTQHELMQAEVKKWKEKNETFGKALSKGKSFTPNKARKLLSSLVRSQPNTYPAHFYMEQFNPSPQRNVTAYFGCIKNCESPTSEDYSVWQSHLEIGKFYYYNVLKESQNEGFYTTSHEFLTKSVEINSDPLVNYYGYYYRGRLALLRDLKEDAVADLELAYRGLSNQVMKYLNSLGYVQKNIQQLFRKLESLIMDFADCMYHIGMINNLSPPVLNAREVYIALERNGRKEACNNVLREINSNLYDFFEKHQLEEIYIDRLMLSNFFFKDLPSLIRNKKLFAELIEDENERENLQQAVKENFSYFEVTGIPWKNLFIAAGVASAIGAGYYFIRKHL